MKSIQSINSKIVLLIILLLLFSHSTFAKETKTIDQIKLHLNIDAKKYQPGETALIVISGNSNDSGIVNISYAKHKIYSNTFANLSIAPSQIVFDIPEFAANGTYSVFASYYGKNSTGINATVSFTVENHNYYHERIFKYRPLELNTSAFLPRGRLVHGYDMNVTNLYTGDSVLLEDVETYGVITSDVSENRILAVPGQAIRVHVKTTDGKYEGESIFAATLDYYQLNMTLHQTIEQQDRIRGMIAIPIVAVVIIAVLVKQKFYGRNKYSRIYSMNHREEIDLTDDSDPR